MPGNVKITLVIGSGGIKCAAAIGMWRILQAEGIQVDNIVGCSGGSVYGAGIAMGLSLEEISAWSYKIWTTDLMRGYTANLKATKSGSLRFNERSGLVDDSVLNNRLGEVYGSLEFSDLKIPLKVVATDLKEGKKILLSDGNLFNAIRASLAIPIIFPPWEIDGRLLIDGGASDPLPIDVAIQDGANIIIAMGFPLSNRDRLRSMTSVQEQLNNIFMNNLLNATYAFYNLAHHAEIFPIIPEFEEPLSMFDVDKLPAIIDAGSETTRLHIPHIKRLLETLD